MTSNDDLAQHRALKLLRQHNPVPDEELTSEQQQVQEQTLNNILGDEASENVASRRAKRLWPVLVAASALVLASVVAVPMLSPQPADAQEVLLQASEAAASAPDLAEVGITGQQFQRRVDADNSGEVTTSMKIDASNVLRVEVATSPGPISNELSTFAQQLQSHNGEPLTMVAEANIAAGDNGKLAQIVAEHYGDDTARGILEFLMLPGVNAEATQAFYRMLAELPGNKVAKKPATEALSNDEVVTIERKGDGLEMSLLPASGRLIEVKNLIAPGVTTTVQAAGLLGCVNIVEQGAPESVSLACADGNYLLTDLTWDNWNAPEAQGRGNAWVNDCDPSCAEAEQKQYPVTVTVSEKRNCGYNLDVYNKLSVTYGEQKPKYSEQQESFDIGCAQ